MAVNLDKVRLNLQDSYNEIVKILNNGYDEDFDEIHIRDDQSLRKLEEQLKDMHNNIAIIMCMYGVGEIENIADKTKLLSPFLGEEADD